MRSWRSCFHNRRKMRRRAAINGMEKKIPGMPPNSPPGVPSQTQPATPLDAQALLYQSQALLAQAQSVLAATQLALAKFQTVSARGGRAAEPQELNMLAIGLKALWSRVRRAVSGLFGGKA